MVIGLIDDRNEPYLDEWIECGGGGDGGPQRHGGKQELLPEGVGSYLRLLLKQCSGTEATIKDPTSV